MDGRKRWPVTGSRTTPHHSTGERLKRRSVRRLENRYTSPLTLKCSESASEPTKRGSTGSHSARCMWINAHSASTTGPNGTDLDSQVNRVEGGPIRDSSDVSAAAGAAVEMTSSAGSGPAARQSSTASDNM